MWIAFAHVAIFALVVFGVILAKDGHAQRDSMLVSIGVGVLILIVYVGPWGILSALSSGLIAYGYAKSS